MVYTELNGTRLLDCTFEDLRTAMAENLFFKFMDDGREGIQECCKDIVDTLIHWMKLRGKPIKINESTWHDIVRGLEKNVVQTLIKEGPAGFGSCVFHAGAMVASAAL